jgi:hypothetical protein
LHCSGRIHFDKDEKQNGKRPKGRSPITEKRKRNTYYRKQSDGHGDVDHEVKKQN